MHIWLRSCALLLLSAAQFSVLRASAQAQSDRGSKCSSPDCPISRMNRQGRWSVLETENFRVHCEGSEEPGAQLARNAESLRTLLNKKWLGSQQHSSWSPKCEIYLHSTKQNYIAVADRGSERTVGSSLVKTDKERISSRRIDLLGANTDFLSAALPHELTHVVLRDRFVSTYVPRWADEGMALLADSADKQERHRRDLRKALADRSTFRAIELLALNDYPPAGRFGTFYGQSASMTEYLVSRKSAEHFVDFIDRAERVGYDTALKECYGIAGVGDLDRQWREHQQPMAVVVDNSITARSLQ